MYMIRLRTHADMHFMKLGMLADPAVKHLQSVDVLCALQMSTSLAEEDLSDVGEAAAIEEEQAACDIPDTGLDNSQQKLDEPASDRLKVSLPAQPI